LDFQETNPDISPESDADCVGFETTVSSCLFSNTPEEVSRHHAACQASGLVSVEFLQVDVVCTGRDPEFQGGAMRTVNYVWDNELFCFPTMGECAAHQTTFCDEWANALAILQTSLLADDNGWEEVNCFPQPGSATCSYMQPPAPVAGPPPTPLPTMAPAPVDTPTATMPFTSGTASEPQVNTGSLFDNIPAVQPSENDANAASAPVPSGCNAVGGFSKAATLLVVLAVFSHLI
jgi:hypothetical protein